MNVQRTASGMKSKLEWFDTNIDAGIYKGLHESGLSLTTYLEECKANKEGKETAYVRMTDREIALNAAIGIDLMGWHISPRQIHSIGIMVEGYSICNYSSFLMFAY